MDGVFFPLERGVSGPDRDQLSLDRIAAVVVRCQAHPRERRIMRPPFGRQEDTRGGPSATDDEAELA